MRTFPKSLALFRKTVNQRGQHLRALTFKELSDIGENAPIEHLVVDKRPATIALIVRPLTRSGGLQVVVQGFMKGKFFPVKHVALDGFYKYPDETTAPLSEEHFWEFD